MLGTISPPVPGFAAGSGAADNPVWIGRLGEISETGIPGRQVMLDDEHEFGNGPELTARLIGEVDDQHRMVVAVDGQIVNDEQKRVRVTCWHNAVQLPGRRSGV